MAKVDCLEIEGREVKLTNLDRVLWPQDNLLKYDLVRYYIEVAPFILPHLKQRPLVFQRFPSGIEEEGFYQKNYPQGAPSWVKTFPIKHEQEKVTNYVIAEDISTLIWIANQSCIEIHPWLSSIPNLDNPDFAVFDLDPMEHSTFDDVRNIALLLKDLLEEFKLKGYPKTSGATGLQIFVPLKPHYSYDEVRSFVEYLCCLINKAYPQKTTMERKICAREGKIYLDYLQNIKGKTLVAPYSPRPLPGAPVSMPLTWKEVEEGGFNPANFNLLTALPRLNEVGEIFSPLLQEKQDINIVLQNTAL